MTEAVAIILAYAIGSVPATWLIHNWRTGDDLRRMGDGNVGSANAIREGSGWFWGHLALLADTGKGLLAISVARWLNLPPVWWMAAGYVVMLGHMYPVWLGFRGGRAAATAMGAAGGFLPWQFGLTFAGGTMTFLLLRVAELGILVVAAPLPFLALAFEASTEAVIFCFSAPMIVGLKAFRDRRQRQSGAASIGAQRSATSV